MKGTIRHAKRSISVVLVACMLAIGLSSSPANAAGGCSGSLCIGTAQGQNPVYLVAYLIVAPPGLYHVHFWNRHNDFNTTEIWVNPGLRIPGSPREPALPGAGPLWRTVAKYGNHVRVIRVALHHSRRLIRPDAVDHFRT